MATGDRYRARESATPGDAADDQARTIGVADAVRAGATHLVVGRPITRAADPRGVYQRLMESV